MKEMRISFSYDGGKPLVVVFRGKRQRSYKPSASRVAEVMELMYRNNIAADIGYTAISFSFYP